jgi:flagella basal body P-ring formation protein FlgA
MTAWLVLLTMMNQPQVCQNIQGDWILGADLARALPAFGAVPREKPLSYSPAPGTNRVFQSGELKRIGAKYGVESSDDVRACFEWKVQRVSEDAVRAAIRETLHAPEARVEVLSISQSPAPEGKLEFPLSGLTVSFPVDQTTPLLWRGRVVYAGHRQFSVWAKVRVTATTSRVVATEALSPSKAVAQNQVRLETYDEFPLPNGVARELEQVIGRMPRRAISANKAVMLADLVEALQVQRGEHVDVTVISGAAHVEMEAVAETSGKQGDVVTLTNPRSGKSFQARIEGKDRALIVTQPFGLQAGAR